MRIVYEWSHGETKVTLFHMNGRYSLKLEKDILEQWYKFREGQIEDARDLERVLKDSFYNKANDIFREMSYNRSSLLEKKADDSDFDTII